jgi:8-oxo-dGTP diphosphatase
MPAEFPSPIPVASCAIVNNGRVLLLRRAIEPFVGQWAFPAGHVEPGENAEAAIEREIHEETGLTVKARYCSSFAKQLDDGRAFLSLMFHAETAEEHVVINEESAEWQWAVLTAAEIDAVDWAFPNHHETARDLCDG